MRVLKALQVVRSSACLGAREVVPTVGVGAEAEEDGYGPRALNTPARARSLPMPANGERVCV